MDSRTSIGSDVSSSRSPALVYMSLEARGRRRFITLPPPSRSRLLVATFSTKLVSVALALPTTVVAARALGPDGRGEYAVLITIIGVAASVGHLSVEHGQVSLRSKGADVDELAANAALLGLGVGGVVGILTTVFVTVTGQTVMPVDRGLFAPLVLVLPLVLLTLYLNGLMVLTDRIGRMNVAMIAASAAQLALTVVLAAADRLTVGTALAVWTIGIAVPVTVDLFTLRPAWRRRSWRVARWTLAFGLRYHPGMAASVLLMQVDVFFLNAMTNTAAVGLYALAVTIVGMVFLLTGSMAQVAIGRQTTAALDEAGDFTLRVTRLSTAAAVLVVAVMVVLAPVAVPTVFGREFTDAVPAVIALAPGVVALAAARPIGAYLIRLDRPWQVSAMYATALLVNVTMNLALIPRLGVIGAGVSSSAAYAVLAWYSLAWFCRSTGHPVRELVPRASDVTNALAALRPREVPLTPGVTLADGQDGSRT